MDRQKEVYYDRYCSTCKYADLSEDAEPCDECLENFSNTDSHKPVCWKEKD